MTPPPGREIWPKSGSSHPFFVTPIRRAPVSETSMFFAKLASTHRDLSIGTPPTFINERGLCLQVEPPPEDTANPSRRQLSASQCEIIQFSERVRPTVLHLSRPSAAWPLESSWIRARSCCRSVHESNLRLQTMTGSLSGGAKHSIEVSSACSRAGAELADMELVGPEQVATIRRYAAELPHCNHGSHSHNHLDSGPRCA